MILNQEKESWHYLVVKELSALLRGIPSKHDGEFYCLNCLHSFRTENRDNILIFNQYTKSDKMPYIIYVVFEYLIKKQIAVQTIKKNLQHQNYVNIFLVDIQCQQFGNLIAQKTSILHITEKIV